jgi:hypothetical protein
MRWAGHLARTVQVSVVEVRERDNLEEQRVDGRIILKRIVKK